MKDPAADLVSVVIPAFNAEETLDETLRSVRGQSYRNIEVIVVDDGSRDQTRSIALRHSAEDARVRVASIPNSGVASARNEGIRLARGSLIAPVDADDLWHPHKIERQVATLSRGGPRMGFVYTLFRRIDMEGRVIATPAFAACEGTVFLRSLVFNFVGNGSALLIRRAALDEIAGYEPELRRQGLEGAEDRLLQCLIAREWRVGAVPSYLTAYRARPGAMSADEVRMLLSQLKVLNLIAGRHPGTPAIALDAARARLQARLAIVMLRRMRLGAATAAARRSLMHSPTVGSVVLTDWLVRSVRGRFCALSRKLRLAPACQPSARFLEADPDEKPELETWWPNGWLRRRLERYEEGSQTSPPVGRPAAERADTSTR